MTWKVPCRHYVGFSYVGLLLHNNCWCQDAFPGNLSTQSQGPSRPEEGGEREKGHDYMKHVHSSSGSVVHETYMRVILFRGSQDSLIQV